MDEKSAHAAYGSIDKIVVLENNNFMLIIRKLQIVNFSFHLNSYEFVHTNIYCTLPFVSNLRLAKIYECSNSLFGS